MTNTTPPKPSRKETPTFRTAKRIAPLVMKHYDTTSLVTWVLYANDEIGLHRFNRNGSHKRLPQ